ncbi:MAG: response regulator [Elusimicrobiota bacterium]
MSVNPIRVLAIEDDQDYVEILRLCLAEPEAMGLAFVLDSAERLAAGLTKLTTDRYDVVMVDLGLPDASGLDAVRSVLGAAPGTPVLVSTNMGDEATALEAMRLGAEDFMIKASSDSRLLKRSIRYAIERKAAQAELRRVEQLQSEIAERRRTDQLKDEWIESIARDLGAMVSAIRNAVVGLEQGRAEPLQPEQSRLVGLARREVERVERLLRLPVARAPAPPRSAPTRSAGE